MQTLIVYYSLEGNTEFVVNTISKKLSADVLKLVPKKAYSDKGFSKFFWGGKSAVMAETPELESYTTDLSKYDQVVIGFPVWAGTFTPPIRTFVRDNKDGLRGKRISVFACQSGAGAEKAFAKLRDFIGVNEFYTNMILIDPKAKPSDKNDLTMDKFCELLLKEKQC